jgi:hypothetical protein
MSKAPMILVTGSVRSRATSHEVRSSLLGEPFALPHGFDAALAAGGAFRIKPRVSKDISSAFARFAAMRASISTTAAGGRATADIAFAAVAAHPRPAQIDADQ